MITNVTNEVNYQFNKRYISADTDEELEKGILDKCGIYWLSGSDIGFCINSYNEFEIYEKHDRVISSTNITFNYDSIDKMTESLIRLKADMDNPCRGCGFYNYDKSEHPCNVCSRRFKDMYKDPCKIVNNLRVPKMPF